MLELDHGIISVWAQKDRLARAKRGLKGDSHWMALSGHPLDCAEPWADVRKNLAAAA